MKTRISLAFLALALVTGCASRAQQVACTGAVERINPPAAYAKPSSAANLVCPVGAA